MTIYSLDVFLSLFGTSSVVPSQGTMMNDSSKTFSDSNQMSVVAFSYESLPRSRIHGLFFFFFFLEALTHSGEGRSGDVLFGRLLVALLPWWLRQ